ncbi:D-alanyl-D-alanine carboxypeptidase [uncultured Secundilactobacillus sp.]|uniref:D-alanyl-D-alanine carboxypeptidase n=1 Tax=uncultured Secundilactobacillus sp. TaxID=2813935 RepID=UPI00258BE8E9|nr:D-alanyl-D-alanine carboxypeptidase [uncultured Secundilactobacillus sp.]
MKKTIKLAIVTFGLLMGLVGISNNTASAKKMPSVPNNYSFDYTKIDSGPIPYYMATKSKKAYIWNYTHTRKIHNLKNYPKTVWLVTNANVKWYNGKKAVYYKVYSAYNPKVKGLVWSGYLAKIIAKDPRMFSSDAEYLNYINSNPSQEVTRKLAKLFPNSKISLNLSQYVASPDNLRPALTGVTDYKDLSRIISYNSPTVEGTPTQMVAKFQKKLEKAGYSTEQRNSMSNYSIGIAVVYNTQYFDNINIYKAITSSPYPGTYANKYYDDNSTRILKLAIAKNK